MISIKHIYKKKAKFICSACEKRYPLILRYTLENKDTGDHELIDLCEECSGNLAKLHTKCMESGKQFKYSKGEIKESEAI